MFNGDWINYYSDDGYCPEGAFIMNDDGTGFIVNSFCDLVEWVAPYLKQWQLHGTMFADGREAALTAGRLFPFYTGVRVVKQNDKYFILYWHKETTI